MLITCSQQIGALGLKKYGYEKDIIAHRSLNFTVGITDTCDCTDICRDQYRDTESKCGA